MPILSEEESALDPYLILELEITATEKDIQRAYRKRSLIYHPDKNHGKSEAEHAILSKKFAELALAQGILNDPAKRTYVDTKLENDRKRKEKYAQSDKKRKDMIDALEQREEDAKKAKVEAQKRRQQEAAEEEIKDAGKRMLAEAQKRAAATSQAASRVADGPVKNGEPSNANTSANTPTNTKGQTRQPPISALDLTLILQFPSTSTLPSDQDSLQSHLAAQYGPINHVFIKDPPADAGGGTKKKKAKGRKAIVEFKEGNWGGCWACWRDCEGEGGKALEGVKVKWAGGSIPDWVAWSETQRLPKRAAAEAEPISNPTPASGNGHQPTLTSTPATVTDGPPRPTFSSAPDFGRTTMSDLLASHNQSRTDERDRKRKEQEFESMTILRMRQMERERLAEQIRLEEDGVI